jgi:hypothetical protein
MYRFDKSRLDLAREFRINPFGKHCSDPQYPLNLMPREEPFPMLLIEGARRT